MNIGIVFLGLAWLIFIASGFIYGFGEIKWFGVLLAAITITLAIRNYKLKKK
jgi:hypothetical protein